jgi:hypothetical protein
MVFEHRKWLILCNRLSVEHPLEIGPFKNGIVSELLLLCLFQIIYDGHFCDAGKALDKIYPELLSEFSYN